jgi:hypothetical protein
LKQHSRTYKDSNLATIGDSAALLNVENTIINDAVEASISNVVHGAPLRASTKEDATTRHRVTTFHGDPGVCWAEFAGGHTMFGKLNLPQARNSTH